MLLWLLLLAPLVCAQTSSCHDLFETAFVEKVAVQIRAGCDINAVTEHGESPLYFACFRGHIAAAKLLLESGAAVDQEQFQGWSPLLPASFHGHLATARLLLERGADPNHVTTKGETPLFAASFSGHKNLAKLLLEHGAIVNQAKNGDSPLYCASFRGHRSMALLLIESGANVKQTNDQGADSLYAACHNGHLATARMLLKHGADPNQVTSDGHTPASIARAQGHEAIIELIAAYQVNSQNSWFPRFAALLATFVALVAACACWCARGGANAARAEAEARTKAARRDLLRETEAAELQRPSHPLTPPPPPATTLLPPQPAAHEPPPREGSSTSTSRINGDDDDATNDADDCEIVTNDALSQKNVTTHDNDGRRYSHVAAVLASLGLGDEIMHMFRKHEIDDGCLGFVDTAGFESIGLPLSTALRVVSAVRAARADASNSSKNLFEDLLDGAAVHQSVLEIKLCDHRAELARLRTVLQARGSEIEECLLCPITFELIHDPVVASDGITYERAAIEEWFETGKATSPLTNAPLVSLVLTPNYLARTLIGKILEECRKQLHRTTP